MLSYDYSHFEICLSSDEEMDLTQIDNMRKDAQRLANKAVKQYQIGKQVAGSKIDAQGNASTLRREVKAIKENFPKSEWTEEQKAKVKKLDQYEYIIERDYDYEDDWMEEVYNKQIKQTQGAG